MPLGFCAYIHLRLPSLSTLARVSRKASLSFCVFFVSVSCTSILITLSPFFLVLNLCNRAFTFHLTSLNNTLCSTVSFVPLWFTLILQGCSFTTSFHLLLCR